MTDRFSMGSLLPPANAPRTVPTTPAPSIAELMGAPPRPEPTAAVTEHPLAEASMAELLGASAPPSQPAGPGRSPRIEPAPAPPVTTPRGDPASAFATEMAERAARSVADEPASLHGLIEVRARPAALWQRITAFIVDGALVGGVLALYVGLAAALISPHGVPSQLTGIDGVMARVHQLSSVLAPCVALALVLGLVYAAAFALLWNGRTPGRRLLGIRLVDRSGLAPTPGRAITRAALAVVSFIPFLAGFWLALFDRRGQTLHDKLTQTFVIRPG